MFKRFWSAYVLSTNKCVYFLGKFTIYKTCLGETLINSVTVGGNNNNNG